MKKFPLIIQGVRREDYINESEILEEESNAVKKIPDIENFDAKPMDTDEQEFSLPEISEGFETLDNVQSLDILGNVSIIPEPEEVEEIQYDEIPQYYTGPKSWKRVTNLHCWTCSNKIVKVPFFVPLSWKKQIVKVPRGKTELQKMNIYGSAVDNKEEYIMKVHGVMCNERCAIRYIKRYNDEAITDKWASIRLLEILTAQLYNISNVSDIQEAPDKSLMMQYVGSKGLTVSEFRNRNK